MGEERLAPTAARIAVRIHRSNPAEPVLIPDSRKDALSLQVETTARRAGRIRRWQTWLLLRFDLLPLVFSRITGLHVLQRLSGPRVSRFYRADLTWIVASNKQAEF